MASAVILAGLMPARHLMPARQSKKSPAMTSDRAFLI